MLRSENTGGKCVKFKENKKKVKKVLGQKKKMWSKDESWGKVLWKIMLKTEKGCRLSGTNPTKLLQLKT